MFLSNRSLIVGKDGPTGAVGDVMPNVGPPMQNVCSVLPRTDTDMLIKVSLHFPGIDLSVALVQWAKARFYCLFSVSFKMSICFSIDV